MRFRRHQEQARQSTRWLVLLFALTVLFTVAGVNAALALAWRLQSGGIVGYPNWFFETNTAVTLGFVLGGAWLESVHLRDGGEHVAALLGGRELVAPRGPAERRLRNVADEMAIATGLRAPRLFLLEREEAINALAAGWDQQDSVIVVTRGALERLTRDELQGVVAHEFAHILNGDTRLNMRLIGMVFGLQMVFNFGRSLMSPVGDHGRRGPAVLAGLALAAVGSVGWLAGRLLKAGVSRQREHLADASAVQFTRLPDGIGNALRKVAAQSSRGQRLSHVNAEVVSHLLLSSETLVRGGWLATHPPLAERLRRIFGRDMAPLADDPVPIADDPVPALPALDFTEAPPPAAAPSVPSVAGAELLAGLGGFALPEQLHAAVLACLVPAHGGAPAELAAWRAAAGAAPAAERLLQAVLALPQRQRLPWFERLLAAAASFDPPQRAALLRDAAALLQADGQLSLTEYLQARVLQRQLSAHMLLRREHLSPARLAEPITTVSLALATLWPGGEGLAWARAALGGLGLPQPSALAPPVLRAVNDALDRMALLGRTHRPALVKQWLRACPGGEIPSALADALRCLCLLLDTPLPPSLAALFDPLPPLPEAPEPSHGARVTGPRALPALA